MLFILVSLFFLVLLYKFLSGSPPLLLLLLLSTIRGKKAHDNSSKCINTHSKKGQKNTIWNPIHTAQNRFMKQTEEIKTANESWRIKSNKTNVGSYLLSLSLSTARSLCLSPQHLMHFYIQLATVNKFTNCVIWYFNIILSPLPVYVYVRFFISSVIAPLVNYSVWWFFFGSSAFVQFGSGLRDWREQWMLRCGEKERPQINMRMSNQNIVKVLPEVSSLNRPKNQVNRQKK